MNWSACRCKSKFFHFISKRLSKIFNFIWLYFNNPALKKLPSTLSLKIDWKIFLSWSRFNCFKIFDSSLYEKCLFDCRPILRILRAENCSRNSISSIIPAACSRFDERLISVRTDDFLNQGSKDGPGVLLYVVSGSVFRSLDPLLEYRYDKMNAFKVKSSEINRFFIWNCLFHF